MYATFVVQEIAKSLPHRKIDSITCKASQEGLGALASFPTMMTCALEVGMQAGQARSESLPYRRSACQDAELRAFVCLFVRPVIHLFIYSCIHLLVRLFVRLLVHLLAHLFVRSLVFSLIRTLAGSRSARLRMLTGAGLQGEHA